MHIQTYTSEFIVNHILNFGLGVSVKKNYLKLGNWQKRSQHIISISYWYVV